MLLESKPIKGIIICLIGYFFFSLVGVFEKSITSSMNISVILFFQNLICFLLILFSRIKQPFSLKLSQQLDAYAFRIASGVGCYAVLFYIIRFMPISEALLYQYTGVLWIPFIMMVWLNSHMPRNLWYGILIGFAGILLILRPHGVGLGGVTFLGIICGILQGLSVVSVRKLSTTEPTQRILFYYFLIGTLITSPFILNHFHHVTAKDAFLLLAIGVSTYLGQFLFTVASKYADPGTLGPICYTSVLYAGLFGWLLWDEIPAMPTLMGMAFVILGCLMTIWLSKPPAKSTETTYEFAE